METPTQDRRRSDPAGEPFTPDQSIMAKLRDRLLPVDDDLDDDEEEIEGSRRRITAPRLRRRPKATESADRETWLSLVRDIPNFVRLLGGLARDPRVSKVDKAIVVATLAYVVMPLDLIPDVPYLGQIDDVFVVAFALHRLLNNAGIDVLLDHWDGEVLNLERVLGVLDRADSFLPPVVRSLMGRVAR